MAKAIQRDEAKRNRAAFLKNVVRGDTSLLVRAFFLCGDYKAKAVQPTNAKHLAVGHGRNAKRNRAAFLKNVVRGDTSLLVRASFILFEIRLCETCFYFKNYVTF